MNKSSVITGAWATNDVQIDGKPLDPFYSQKFRNHSPDGFSWGYQGSGPSQLALALLLEAMGWEDALMYYQEFKRDVISGLPKHDFSLPATTIFTWIEGKEKERENH